ncbi:MAG: hypothetical protein HC913_01305 [Microscillaceae bacterium]|nr:hypothetical protein [Microscillaceae bacterium]
MEETKYSELGGNEDLKLLADDFWLHNAQVSYRIVLKKGRWHLSILFIHQDKPLVLRIRAIADYASEAQARLYAQIFQRGIQRDARGTFKTNYDAFNFFSN